MRIYDLGAKQHSNMFLLLMILFICIPLFVGFLMLISLYQHDFKCPPIQFTFWDTIALLIFPGLVVLYAYYSYTRFTSIIIDGNMVEFSFLKPRKNSRALLYEIEKIDVLRSLQHSKYRVYVKWSFLIHFKNGKKLKSILSEHPKIVNKIALELQNSHSVRLHWGRSSSLGRIKYTSETDTMEQDARK